MYEAIQVISIYLIRWLLNIPVSHVSKNLYVNVHLIEHSKVKFNLAIQAVVYVYYNIEIESCTQ